MATPCVLSFPGTEPFRDALARGLEAESLPYTCRRFPDGETYVRIDGDVRDRAVVVIASLFPPDERILPVVLLAETARDLGARAVVLVAPYLAYLRQDGRFRPGEGITARYVARLLSDRFDGLVAVDPHLHRLSSLEEVYDIPCRHVRSAPRVAAWIAEHVERPFLVGPDLESGQWVEEVATRLDVPHVLFRKDRHGDRDVRLRAPGPLDIPGTPVLLDDIVSTGHTMLEALRMLVRPGAPAPVCIAIHGVFADGAERMLLDAGAARIVSCTTLPHPTNGIDLGKDIVAPVRDLL